MRVYRNVSAQCQNHRCIENLAELVILFPSVVQTHRCTNYCGTQRLASPVSGLSACAQAVCVFNPQRCWERCVLCWIGAVRMRNQITGPARCYHIPALDDEAPPAGSFKCNPSIYWQSAMTLMMPALVVSRVLEGNSLQICRVLLQPLTHHFTIPSM